MARNANVKEVETSVGIICIPKGMFNSLDEEQIEDSRGRLAATSTDSNWNDVLGAASNTLVALGFCFIVARMSGGAFKCKKGDSGLPSDLKSCITGCYDRSLKSFTVAGNKMEQVATCMNRLLGKRGSIAMIEKYLGEAHKAACDPSSDGLKDSMEALTHHLKTLVHEVEICIGNTKEVNDQFDDWLAYTEKVILAFTGLNEGIKAQGGLKRMHEYMKSLGSSKAAEVTDKELAELNQLFSKGVTHGETVQILDSSLNALSTIKDNLRRITEFINKAHNRLKTLQENQLENVQESARRHFCLKNEDELSIIYANMFDARVELMIAGIQSRMYATASKRLIMPGMDTVTTLSKEDGKKNITNEVNMIASYAKTSQGKIQDVVKEVLKPGRAIAGY